VVIKYSGSYRIKTKGKRTLQQVNRILVARIGRVGDMIMITPAIQALLTKYPQANITILTSNDGIRTLKNFNERVDKFIVYNRKAILPWLVCKKIKKSLKKEHYDKIYCFESKPSFQNLFSELDSTIYALQSTSDKSIHYSQYCLDLVSPESNQQMAFTVRLPVTEEAKTDARTQLQKGNINDNNFIIGFHPSFSGLAKLFGRAKKQSHHKVWPIAFWSSLAIQIQEYAIQHKLTIKIIMDLIPDEESIGHAIKEQSNSAALYQCPPLNFERYKATLARYDLLITPDSGPMHIAAAVNTKVIALFSQHHPSDCQPFVANDQFTVLRAEDMDEPEKGLAAIAPETVLKACLAYLPN